MLCITTGIIIFDTVRLYDLVSFDENLASNFPRGKLDANFSRITQCHLVVLHSTKGL